MYMQGGWTIDETNNEGCAFYWIVSPLKTDVMSFPSKIRARMYWQQYGRQLMSTNNIDSGRTLAEESGVEWDALDEFEQQMWTKMAGDLAKEQGNG